MYINPIMYFSRFNLNILKEALHKKYITTEEYYLIENFWYKSILYCISKEDVQFLKSYGIECELIENTDRINELDKNTIKITHYPHLKSMCLKVCKRNPKKWLYEDESEGIFLFGFIISVDQFQLVKSKDELEL